MKSKAHILEKYWIGQNLGFIKPNPIQGQSKIVIQSNLQNPTQSSTNPNGILKRKFLFGLESNPTLLSSYWLKYNPWISFNLHPFAEENFGFGKISYTF